MLKCVGCRHLIREAQDPDKVNPKFPLVVYGCEEEWLDYWTSLGGLLRPGKLNQQAADQCKHDFTKECVVCGSQKGLIPYGGNSFMAIRQVV